MKKIGLQPIPMMDRDKKDEVPQGQVRPALLLMCLWLHSLFIHTHARRVWDFILMVWNNHKKEDSDTFKRFEKKTRRGNLIVVDKEPE